MIKLNKILKKLKIHFSKNPYKAKENYITAHPDINWWEKHLNQKIIRETIYLMGDHVADFGCNHGCCSLLMAREGVSVTGIDLNQDALKVAENIKNNQNNEIKNRLNFVCSQFNELTAINDDSFTGAYMLDVFEHIYPADRPKIFKEIKRVMKKGAYLMLVTPYEHAYDDGIQHVDFFDCAKLQYILEEELDLEVITLNRDQRQDDHGEVHDRINALVRF